MKFVQAFDLETNPVNMDKAELCWSLSWHPDGRCDSFTKKAILAYAPPTSGVYGLFNFDCQVFIGESKNIQEALLRHESETDFQSRHLQPTGFTFELCASEIRKAKADELIARFHPVLQTEAALTEVCSPSNSSVASNLGLGSQVFETNADHQEFPAREREKRPKIHRRFYFKRTPAAALAAMFAASALLILYLGVLTNKNFQRRVNGASERPGARISIVHPRTSDQAGTGLRAQNVYSIQTADEFATQSPEPAKPDVHASDSTADSIKKWSVQISAVPAKAVADSLADRLIANGYDGYVIQAEIKGQTYYRVRVGHFDAREEAESARQSLSRQEGYRDAYLTGD
jgi:septal ring-binding cell division protein DamX